MQPISFHSHIVRTGSEEGARADFQRMVTDLLAAVLPGVRAVRANPGDWGIDTFVGRLDSGSVTIWQSKFFLDDIDKSQKDQIREAFKSASTNAKRHGFEIGQWVLCIPTSMDGPATKWWDGWRRRTASANDVAIELWDETQLRKRLISPEGQDVRHFYYGLGKVLPDELAVLQLPEGETYEHALFVRQLLEAEHSELSAAKREFFNADLIAREVRDKGVPEEVAQLVAADAAVNSLWEHRYNDACSRESGRLLPGLHADVMADIRSERSSLMPIITTSLIHTCGLVHRVVEEGRAGWVRDWRNIAAQYESTELAVEAMMEAVGARNDNV